MNQTQALLLTLACEVPVLLALAHKHVGAKTPVSQTTAAPQRRRWWPPVLLAAIAASCFTHPLAWHAASVLAADEYRRGIWLIEALVVLAEALVYSLLLRPGWRLALLWSALANGTSFGLGQLLP